MKKTLFYLAIASLSFLACTKNDNTNPSQGGGGTLGVSTTVFYVDTFRIYSTDLKGGNRKLVVDEDLKSQNNYITQISILPTTQQLVYGYYDGVSRGTLIKTCKFDGSSVKVIKSINAGSSIGFVKGTSDGNIYYQTNTFTGGTVASRTFSIKADGTGETELQGFLYGANINEAQISNQGKGVLSRDGYFGVIANGVFDERNSFNIFLNEDKDKTKFRTIILSADAKKAAFLLSTSTTGKYELRVKDVIKDVSASTVLYTLNIPADANQYSPHIYFVNGSSNVLVAYGKFTSPKGSPNDFTNCDLVDIATGKVTQNWKFTGDDIGIIVVD